MSRLARSHALATGALILGLTHAAVAQTCVPVSGKVVNNFAAADGSLTQGVVEMDYGAGAKATKLKCALSGQATEGPGAINFVHSISCSDAIKVPAWDGSGKVPVHSSIVLYTTGTIGAPALPTQEFSFTERSVPITDAPARGLFYGVTGGHLDVEGVVYKSPVAGVPGSIDMKFTGEVCYGQ